MHKSWMIVLLIMLAGCGWKPFEVCELSLEGKKNCDYYISKQSYEAKRKREFEALRKEVAAYPDDYRDIAVVVIKEFLNGRSFDGITEKYFVSVLGEDLDEVLSLKLMRSGISAEPASKFVDKHGSVDASGNMIVSIRLEVPVIKRLSNGAYRVGFQYYCGVLCAGSWEAQLRKEQDGWVIVSQSTPVFS